MDIFHCCGNGRVAEYSLELKHAATLTDVISCHRMPRSVNRTPGNLDTDSLAEPFDIPEDVAASNRFSLR